MSANIIDYRSKEVLHRLYWDEELTMNQIAGRAGFSAITIRSWMIKNGVRIRNWREARLTAQFQDFLGKGRSKYCNKETLAKLYHEQQLSGEDIAKLAGVDRHTVVSWLRGFGLQVRSNKASKNTPEYSRKFSGKNHPNFKDGKRTLYSGWGYKMLKLYGRDRIGHRCDKAGRIAEHAYVMERYIKRPLKKGEVVHHVNFERMDNRIENLILFPSQSTHTLYHSYLERVGAYHLGILKEMPKYALPQGAVVGAQS